MKSIPRQNCCCDSQNWVVKLRDCDAMTWQDPNYCANCYKDISTCSSKSFKQELDYESHMKFGVGRITLVEALNVVFDINQNSFRTNILLNEDSYSLCQNCWILFKKLFRLFTEFCNVSSSPSFLYAFVGSKLNKLIDPMVAIPIVQMKHDVNDPQEENPQFLEDFEEGTEGFASPEGFESEVDSEVEDTIISKGKRTKADAWSICHASQDKRTRTTRGRKVKRIDYSVMEAGSGNEEYYEDFSALNLKEDGLPEKDPMYTADDFGDEFFPVDSEDEDSDAGIQTNQEKFAEPKNKSICRNENQKPRPRIHVCTECNIGFSRSNHLSSHMEQHAKKTFICDCGVGFARAYSLKYHQKRLCKLIPNSRVLSKSEVRSAVEKKLKNLQRRHSAKLVKKAASRTSHRNSRFVCEHPDCGKTFDRPYRLRRHQIIHETKPFVCKFCRHSFRNEETLTNHIGSSCKVNNSLVFEEQSNPFDDPEHITKNSRRNAKPSKNVPRAPRVSSRHCACYCGETFSRTNHLRDHVKIHSVKNVICSDCSAGFLTQERLEKHLKVHDPSIAPINQESFRHFAKEDGTIVTVKMKPKRKEALSDKSFQCEICGKQVLKIKSKVHLATHQSERPAVCEFCGFAFKTVHDMKNHQKWVHTSERPFLCNECGRSFKRSQHLTEHQTVAHSGSRNFKCNVCGKYFKTKKHLVQHSHVHKGHKFDCGKCGHVFTRQYNLKLHLGRGCSGLPSNKGRKCQYDTMNAPSAVGASLGALCADGKSLSLKNVCPLSEHQDGLHNSEEIENDSLNTAPTTSTRIFSSAQNFDIASFVSPSFYASSTTHSSDSFQQPRQS